MALGSLLLGHLAAACSDVGVRRFVAEVLPARDIVHKTDRSATLEQMVVARGDLAIDVPEVDELDLNPVMCTPAATVLVDVEVRLRAAAGTRTMMPRPLGLQPDDFSSFSA